MINSVFRWLDDTLGVFKDIQLMSLLMTANKIISLVFITKHIYIGKGLICYMLHYYDKKKVA